MTVIDQILPVWTILARPEFKCNAIHEPGQWWNHNHGAKQHIFGWWSIAFAAICEVLYIPCTIAIYFEAKQRSCYKIMFFLGLVDIVALMTMSMIFGISVVRGEVFCSNPVLHLVSGSIALGTWCGASAGCLLLVTNRLFEVLGIKFFDGTRTNVFIMIVLCYALFITLLTPPVFTNSPRMGIFFDPYINGRTSKLYSNYFHTANNLLIVVITMILYIILCVVLVVKQGSQVHRKRLRTTKNVYIQASLICLFNVVAAYVYANFVSAPEFVVIFGQVAWQLVHGAPPFIYLLLNKTIRGRCKKFMQSTLFLS